MAVSASGGSSGIRAGRAFVELFTKDAGLRAGLANAQAMLQKFSSFSRTAGLSLMGASAAAGGALAGIFAGAVSRDAGFDSISKRLGDTTENLSALAYAAKTTGIDLNGLLDNFENWPERLVEAANGGGEAAEVFKMLGINASEMAKLPITEQMIGLAEAMQKVGNDSQRLMILGKLFSDKGQGFNELFKLGGGGIRRLMAEAGDVGAVVGTAQAQAATRVEKAWNKSVESVKNSFYAVGEALLPLAPVLEQIGGHIASAAKIARDWIAENKGIVATVGAVVVAVGAIGAALVGVGTVLAGISVAWSGFVAAFAAAKGIIVGAVTLISSPIIAIPAALALAAAAWFAFTDSGRAAAAGIGSVFMSIFGDTFSNIKSSWNGVVSALGRGDISGAFSIGVSAMRVEWARLTVWLTDYWNRFKNIFLDGWRDVVLKFSNLWASAVQGTAGILTSLAGAAGIYTKEQVEQIRKTMNEDALAEQKQRNAAAINAVMQGKDSRKADLDSAMKDLADAEKNHRELLRQNTEKDRAAWFGGVITQAATSAIGETKKLANIFGLSLGSKSNELIGLVQKASAASRGVMGGDSSYGFFNTGFTESGSASVKPVAEKQLAEQKETNKLLKQILDRPSSQIEFK